MKPLLILLLVCGIAGAVTKTPTHDLFIGRSNTRDYFVSKNAMFDPDAFRIPTINSVSIYPGEPGIADPFIVYVYRKGKPTPDVILLMSTADNQI